MSSDQNLELIPKTQQALWKRCLITLLKSGGEQLQLKQFVKLIAGNDELKIEGVLLFLFCLRGLGYVAFNGSGKIVYAGRNAVIIKFLQFVNAQKNRLVQEGKVIESQSKVKKSSMNTALPFCFRSPEEGKKFVPAKIELEGQVIEAKLYHYAADFAEKVIFSILFDQNKILSKAHLQQFLDYYKKAFGNAQLFESTVHLFQVLQFLNISVQSPTIIWQGPDYINCLGVCADDLYQIVHQKKTLEEVLYEHLRSFNNELFNREMMFYRQLFINDLKDSDFDQILQAFLRSEEHANFNEKTLKKLLPQLQVGYALLKGKTQNIMIKKLQSIIGRKPARAQSRVRWQVDINLGPSRKISKQHALILYNFETQSFELLCLSQKYPVLLNNKPLTHTSPPAPLKNGALITVGEENFYFLLPLCN